MALWRLMHEGGWGMWFVLAFGLVTLAAAGSFARSPASPRLAAVRSFNLATWFAVLSTVSIDLAKVANSVANIPKLRDDPRMPLILLQGISESLAPATLGFALLSFAWILVAIGQRRQANDARHAREARASSS
jgi:hypothetical protein